MLLLPPFHHLMPSLFSSLLMITLSFHSLHPPPLPSLTILAPSSPPLLSHLCTLLPFPPYLSLHPPPPLPSLTIPYLSVKFKVCDGAPELWAGL